MLFLYSGIEYTRLRQVEIHLVSIEVGVVRSADAPTIILKMVGKNVGVGIGVRV